MKELLETIARALVDKPEQVQVRASEGEETVVLELHVDPSDLGKAIGKQGRLAESMRTIFGAVGMKFRKRVTVDILQ